jgi:ADP-dependent NAD(P)H-hydrate dehydratase / NAD(P)H-hydrate epimerase
MRIVTQKEMKLIEKVSAEKYFFNEHLIVENVGLMGAKVLEERLKVFGTDLDVIVMVGKGNNGADGLSLARHLVGEKRSVRAFTLFEAKECSPELQEQLKMAQAYGVKLTAIKDVDGLESYFAQNPLPKVVVDAIFGTGVRLPLSQFIYDVIQFLNASSNYTVSLDIPTGVVGDTGLAQGNAIKADLTLAVGFPKVGHFVADGALLTGEVKTLEVGFPQELVRESADKFLLTRDNLPYQSDIRNKFADKKIFGHTLVIGGSHGLTGAVTLASVAALKSGSGLVTAATWEPQHNDMISRLIPEVMTGYVPMDEAKWGKVLKGLGTYSSIVIGPGLGRSARARRLVLEILNNFSGPLVLDADAINVLNLNEDSQVFAMRHAPTILTPHYGEFARFCGIPLEEVQHQAVDVLKKAVERVNCTIVLKGPCTYMGLASGKTYFNFSPNDGMASGGVGDVLAGILGGLLAQDAGLRREEEALLRRYEHANQATLLSVYIHSLSGKFAAEKFGVRTMTAMSLIESLPQAFNDLDGDV